jgi:hypothetical protein
MIDRGPARGAANAPNRRANMADVGDEGIWAKMTGDNVELFAFRYFR